ncbi:MAG: 3-hydroxyacyl-CoA dehydrogenase NAD-binding domain-containing protein [Gammaproteobacteria bacterium]|nr:3-hydroxyacyl-CoA dehydrogenase NAD-binding domain-containing protein [Gammaproteobacteria bacterium]
MQRSIDTVAVLGAGTMGAGIAAACAQAGSRVHLLDLDAARVGEVIGKMTEGRAPMLDDPAALERISAGSFDDLSVLADCDWICEAVVEDLAIKQDLFRRVEAARKEGSVVSTNTSGIPLRAIVEGMPERFRRDFAVTHFFNPVKVMRLLELVPGEDTDPEALAALRAYCAETLGKGVVLAKDTVNFIGNRIGCFWILSGLHKGRAALEGGLTMEKIDALMSAPVGLPPTGLYGLVDLIGLDVMDLVGKNLAANLPEGDVGREYAAFPPTEQAMLERGQLGRKSGGGFYRVTKRDDGSKLKEVFDLLDEAWRVAEEVTLEPEHADASSLLFADTPEGRFAWDLMGGTLCYAADLVPEISDTVVGVDRAMRWGFNWQRGPFEMLDALGPDRVIARLEDEGRALPRMLAVLRDAGAEAFYRNDGSECLGPDGQWQAVEPE